MEDRYRILGVIGDGGMGKVFRAERLATGETVALKLLHPEFSAIEKVVMPQMIRGLARAEAKKRGLAYVGAKTDGSVHADAVDANLAGIAVGVLVFLCSPIISHARAEQEPINSWPSYLSVIEGIW